MFEILKNTLFILGVSVFGYTKVAYISYSSECHPRVNEEGRCCEKNKGKDPCVESKDTTSCKFCSAFTPEQLAQISTPSYKIKKEKHEARKSVTATPTNDSSELVDPASVSVIGVVGHQDTTQQTEPVKSPSTSSMPEKKAKKEKVISKAKKSSESSSTDSKIADLDSKWSEHFNRLEALLLSKTFQSTFSSDVKLTPSHSPPTNVPRDSEPFFQPTGPTGTAFSTDMHQAASQPESDSQSTTTERTGKGFSATQHQPASQLTSDQREVSSVSTKRTGKGSSASQHQPASQLITDRPTSRSPQRRTGIDSSDKGFSASQHQPTSQPTTEQDRHGHVSTDPSLRQGTAGRSPTDHCLLLPPTPALPLSTGTGKTVHLVIILGQTVIIQTDHRSTSMLRRGNCRTILNWLQNQIKYPQRNKPIGRQ